MELEKRLCGREKPRRWVTISQSLGIEASYTSNRPGVPLAINNSAEKFQSLILRLTRGEEMKEEEGGGGGGGGGELNRKTDHSARITFESIDTSRHQIITRKELNNNELERHLADYLRHTQIIPVIEYQEDNQSRFVTNKLMIDFLIDIGLEDMIFNVLYGNMSIYELFDQIFEFKGFESLKENDWKNYGIKPGMVHIGKWEITMLKREDGNLQAVISDRTRMMEAINESTTDQLTGAGNRYFFESRAEKIAERYRNIEEVDKQPVMVYFDLNDFKQVNDKEGYSKGDEVLQILCEITRDYTREGAIRIGGEEFALIFEGLTENEVRKKVKKIQARLTERTSGNFFKKLTSPVTFSAGIATLGPNESYQSWTKRADQACNIGKFHKKSDPKNCIQAAKTVNNNQPKDDSDSDNYYEYYYHNQRSIEELINQISSIQAQIRYYDKLLQKQKEAKKTSGLLGIITNSYSYLDSRNLEDLKRKERELISELQAATNDNEIKGEIRNECEDGECAADSRIRAKLAKRRVITHQEKSQNDMTIKSEDEEERCNVPIVQNGQSRKGLSTLKLSDKEAVSAYEFFRTAQHVIILVNESGFIDAVNEQLLIIAESLKKDRDSIIERINKGIQYDDLIKEIFGYSTEILKIKENERIPEGALVFCVNGKSYKVLARGLKTANGKTRRQSTISESTSEKLLMQARIDRLTGAANRKAAEELIAKDSQELDDKSEYSILFLDLDRFSRVNKLGGHDLGDRVLQAVYECVIEFLKHNNFQNPEDIFTRWGGEEWVLFLKEVDNNKAAALAEKIKQVIASDIKIQNLLIGNITNQQLTTSIGVASFNLNTDSGGDSSNGVFDLQKTLVRASTALKAAKVERNVVVNCGKNCLSGEKEEQSETELLTDYCHKLGADIISIKKTIKNLESHPIVNLRRIRRLQADLAKKNREFQILSDQLNFKIKMMNCVSMAV